MELEDWGMTVHGKAKAKPKVDCSDSWRDLAVSSGLRTDGGSTSPWSSAGAGSGSGSVAAVGIVLRSLWLSVNLRAGPMCPFWSRDGCCRLYWFRGVGSDVVLLHVSHSEGGSAHPQGIIYEFDDGTVILLQQQHLAEDVVHPANITITTVQNFEVSKICIYKENYYFYSAWSH